MKARKRVKKEAQKVKNWGGVTMKELGTMTIEEQRRAIYMAEEEQEREEEEAKAASLYRICLHCERAFHRDREVRGWHGGPTCPFCKAGPGDLFEYEYFRSTTDRLKDRWPVVPVEGAQYPFYPDEDYEPLGSSS